MSKQTAPSLLQLCSCGLSWPLAPINTPRRILTCPAPTTACSASRPEGEMEGKSEEV